jgi:hypothetical protein
VRLLVLVDRTTLSVSLNVDGTAAYSNLLRFTLASVSRRYGSSLFQILRVENIRKLRKNASRWHFGVQVKI